MTLETFEEEEDDSEFLDPLQIQEEERSNPELEIEFKAVKRYRNFVSKALDRGVSLKQILPFRALAEIDEDRKDKIGLKELFLSYCENCNYSWLSPGKPFGVLEETLRKFQGDRKVLIPIVSLLTEISRSSLSPAAFLRYVILPRLKWDQNWRNWEKNHYSHFREIQRILLEIQKCPQFEKQTIGGESMHLARDIVLVKYIGLPLANLEPKIVSNLDFSQNYISHWSEIQFQNILFFQLLKQSILPFLFHFSGKLEGFQIFAILENLPQLEKTLQEFYPDSIYNWQYLPNFFLYERNFHHGKEERLQKGFKILDFFTEIKGYLIALRKALETRAGVSLAEYITKQIIWRKNPKLPEQLCELILLLPNQGGLHAYKWHVRRMTKVNSKERETFLSQVQSNNGFHPEFRPPFWFYEREGKEFDEEELEDLGRELGLDEFMDSQKNSLSPRILLQAYYSKNPENKELLETVRKAILEAKDRELTQDMISKVDEIHSKMHRLLLRTTIRGIAKYFSSWKSDSFKELWDTYRPVHSQPNISLSYNFRMMDTTSADSDRLLEEKIRKSIHLDLFSLILQYLDSKTESSFSEFTAILGEELITLRRARENIEERMQSILSEETETNSHKLSSLEKSLKAMDSKKESILQILENSSDWSLEMKVVTAIFYASHNWEVATPGMGNVYTMILSFLKNQEEIQNRLYDLLSDIHIKNLQFYQVEALYSFLSFVSLSFQNLPNVQKLWEEKEYHKFSNFFEILSKYSSIKRNNIQASALDACLKKLFQLGKISREKSKWLDFIKKSESEPTYKYYTITSNKGFIDAYFGDMGGICLSYWPRNILRPNLTNFRMVDLNENRIIGMFLLAHSKEQIKSRKITDFYSAFAINPLFSALLKWSTKEKVFFYLNVRLVLEKIAILTGKPIFLAGRNTYGLLSEGLDYAYLINNLESSLQSPKVDNAYSIDIYYDKEAYAQAIYIVDPKDEKTFHAHRLLRIQWGE